MSRVKNPYHLSNFYKIFSGTSTPIQKPIQKSVQKQKQIVKEQKKK